MMSKIASVAILSATLAAAQDTYPDARGPCFPTQGGDNSCGPNGSEDWLNSGLEGDRWNPPFLDINSLAYISTEDFYNGESSCDADIPDNNGTPGLMQCSPANCQNGQGSCQYPIQDNVDCGAYHLRSQLDNSSQNAIRAIGSYNGWFTAEDNTGLNGGRGLTASYPCSDEGRRNGAPQNLNYIHETINGWFQGKDMYGSDQNLDGKYNCQGNCDSGTQC